MQYGTIGCRCEWCDPLGFFFAPARAHLPDLPSSSSFEFSSDISLTGHGIEERIYVHSVFGRGHEDDLESEGEIVSMFGNRGVVRQLIIIAGANFAAKLFVDSIPPLLMPEIERFPRPPRALGIRRSQVRQPPLRRLTEAGWR